MKSQFGASLVWKNLYSLNASGLQRPSKGMAKAIREIYSEAAESSCWEEFELSASKCSFFLCFFVRGDLIFVLHSYISHVFTFLFLVRDHECCQLSKKKRLLLSFGSGLSRCRHDWSFFLRLFDIKGVSFEHRFYRDDVLYSLDIFEHFALIKPSSCFLFFSLMLDMLAVITALKPSPPLYEVLQHVLYHHTQRVLVPNVPLMISFLALYQPLWTQAFKFIWWS